MIQDGRTIQLWFDLWNNKVHNLEYPELFSYAKNLSVTLSAVHGISSLIDLFHLPRSVEACAQLGLLEMELSNQTFSQQKDVWTYVWGSNLFSSQKAYDWSSACSSCFSLDMGFQMST